MPLITQLVGFGLRQVIGDYADSAVQIAAAVEQRFRDHSRTLPKALDRAHHRAWQALGVALAGEGLLHRVKVFFASGDDKGVREQVQLFLDGNAVSFEGTPADFRRDCLNELQRLRKSGRLSTQQQSPQEIARQAASFRRHADPQGLVEEAQRAVDGVADALTEGYPNLARLLRTPTPAGPPLLAAAFCYFFRREVETNDELAHGLFLDGLRQLSASQAKAFGEVGQALESLGGQFDALFEQLGRIEAAVEETHTVAVETHGAVLDIQTELRRSHGEARILMEQVLLRLGQVGMARGEVRPGNSCSIRGEDERRAVKALLARYRGLPAEEQRQAPALLNGLGKLQVGAGDFTEARQTFTEVVQAVGNPTDKAEASFNAYRAALEEKKWDAALTALREAGSHDPQRFAPFPLHRYEPKRILGAGGFGTAILCLDRHFDEDVVVKTLHAADLARGVDDVFREARILRQLSHPAIVGVRDCEYADPDHKARPYQVMDHFPGGTLQEFVEQRGTLNLEQLVAVAVQVAEGMKAAHDQGVLHRDLKPANLLVRKEGNLWKVKIIDFGLALRQQTVETSNFRSGATQKSMLDWSVAGTLEYAPPEQLGKLPGVQPGPYSDAYAFARTCCFAMFKTTELRRKQWDSLAGPLADLLEGCLDPDPMQRPSGFEVALAALGECAHQGRGRIAPVAKAAGQPRRSDPEGASDLDAIIAEFTAWQERFNDGVGTKTWLLERVEHRLSTWKAAANRGMMEAQALLADCYYEGVGVPQDYVQAYQLWLPAADRGIPSISCQVGAMLLPGTGGLTVDQIRAFQYLTVAAKGGWRPAYLVLGSLFLRGMGTAVNVKDAEYWLKRSAEEAQNAHAMLMLAEMYLKGSEGLAQDLEAVRHWSQKAREKDKDVDYQFYKAEERSQAMEAERMKQEAERMKQARLALPLVELTLSEILLEPAEFNGRRVRIRGTYLSLYASIGQFSVEQGDHRIDVDYAQLAKDQKSIILRGRKIRGRAVVVEGIVKGDKGMPDLIATQVVFAN